MSRHRSLVSALSLALGAALLGCNDTQTPTEGDVSAVFEIVVTPAAAELTELGDTLRLTAVGNGPATVTAAIGDMVGRAEFDVQLAPMQLTDAEAEEISEQLTSAALEGLDFAFGQAFGPGGAAAAASASSPEASTVTFRVEFEIQRACPIDGSINLAGVFEGEFDPEERTGQFALEAIKVVDFCMFPHGDVIITIHTEDPHIRIAAASRREGRNFHSELHIEGALFIETSDGRSATCEIELWIERSRSEDGSEFHKKEGTVCTHDVGDDGGETGEGGGGDSE